MFTGIIESMATIISIEREGTNLVCWLEAPVSDQFHIDQSVAHNGICLTIDAQSAGRHRVTAVAETIAKTNLGEWAVGDWVNLERCMQLNGRLDGHLVQGHIDATGVCLGRKDLVGSWAFRFQIPVDFAPLIIEKGSVCVNGVSLTLFDVTEDAFSVAIIPYTFAHTNLQSVTPGSLVNLEFDVIGKYINRMERLQKGVN